MTVGTLAVGLQTIPPAFAQQPEGAIPQLIQVGSPADGIFFIAGNEAAQKDVGIDGDVASRVQGIVRDYENEMYAERDRIRAAVEAVVDLGKEERQAKVKDIRDKRTAAVARIKEKFLPQLEAAVAPAQFERLQQLAFQLVGSEALVSDPRVVKALDLTDEQKKEISAINAEYRRKRLGQVKDQSDLVARLLERDKERNDKAEARLSKVQQEKLKALKGKPFDLSLLRTK